MPLERLARLQPPWMRREGPLTPTSPVRLPFCSLHVLCLTNDLESFQNTSLKLRGTWIPEDPRSPTNVDPNTTTPLTNSTNGMTEVLLPAQPRRNTEKAHARTVVR